ncbi:MAG TPA: protease complex subunit PrcB family protein [Longimicrobium sp.]|nr:protease complex subunit PrcB family protein [Longimicrobium sp.]
MKAHLTCALAVLAALGCTRPEDRPRASGAPDTVVFAQMDTAGVQVPPELSAFCRPGTRSLRPAGAPPTALEAGDSVPAQDVYREKLVYLGQPVRCVVRRHEEWAALWSAITRGVTLAPPVPPVDFGTRMVLVAGMGPHPSTGYGIGITGVRRTENGIIATVLRYTPGLCPVGMGITEPLHAVGIPREETSVEFVERISYGPDCLE